MKAKNPKSFIVSSGRAGSTLLQSILNSSQQIYIPRESDFVARAYPFFKDKTKYDTKDYELLAALFSKTSQDDGWEMETGYVKAFLEKNQPQSFADAFNEIFQAYCESENIETNNWAIKHPVLISSLDVLGSVYPVAKIVHMCRDGRDVYLSYKNIHEKSGVKFGPKGVVSNALYWVDGLRRVEEYQKENEVFEITYEGLLENTETELEKLCEFLDIRYCASMTQNYGKQRQEIPKSFSASIHKNLSKGLMIDNTKKYLSKMTKLQIFIYEIIASPYLKKYEYPLEYGFTASILFSPLRICLYSLARMINISRYRRRDKKTYEKCYL